MERKIISQRIGEILDDINRLNNALYAMNTTDIQRYPENYEVLSTDAALRAERIACRLRNLIYSTTNVRKTEYLNAAGEAHGIEIDYENGVMQITLPSLLPKRKFQKYAGFLLDPFYFSLSEYAESHTLLKYRECVVCFSHVYSRDCPTRRVRDYDNLELKVLLDVLSAFLLVDDTGLLCDAYNTTELGEKDCTKIFVMEKERFSAWLAQREKCVKSVSDF